PSSSAAPRSWKAGAIAGGLAAWRGLHFRDGGLTRTGTRTRNGSVSTHWRTGTSGSTRSTSRGSGPQAGDLPRRATRGQRVQRSTRLGDNGAVELERDFAAWADRHDAEALARVCDGTAGRLLLVASQLA